MNVFSFINAFSLFNSSVDSQHIIKIFNKHSTLLDEEQVLEKSKFISVCLGNDLYHRDIFLNMLKIQKSFQTDLLDVVIYLNKQLTSNMRTIFDTMKMRLVYLQSCSELKYIVQDLFDSLVSIKKSFELFSVDGGNSKRNNKKISNDAYILWIGLIYIDNVIYSMYIHLKQINVTEKVNGFFAVISQANSIIHKQSDLLTSESNKSPRINTQFPSKTDHQYSNLMKGIMPNARQGSNKVFPQVIKIEEEKYTNSKINRYLNNYDSLLLNYLEQNILK